MTAVYVSDFETRTGETAEQKAWDIAATVCDPEIPVLTIEDLGILRGVKLFDDGGGWPPLIRLRSGGQRAWAFPYRTLK